MPPETQEPRQTVEDWMTAEELAAWFGVSKRVLSANAIPHARVGERRFYNKHTVAEWLDSKQQGLPR